MSNLLTGSSDNNESNSFCDERTSHETGNVVEEDTFAQFCFVEETLQITDVYVSVFLRLNSITGWDGGLGCFISK